MTSAQFAAIWKRISPVIEGTDIGATIRTQGGKSVCSCIEPIEQDLLMCVTDSSDVTFIPIEGVMSITIDGDYYEPPEWVCPIPTNVKRNQR